MEQEIEPRIVIENIWTEVVDVWQHGLLGIDISSIIIALAIFGGFLMIRGLFSKYILTHLRSWAGRTPTQIDDKVVEALIPPIRFIPVILGLFFAFKYTGLDVAAGEFFARTIRTLIAFTIFWSLHRALEPISQMMRQMEKILTPLMVRWIFRTLKVMVIFIGAAVILEIWGIAVGPLLAGLGLFGAAVALGAQDLFKNLIGGLTIIAEKRFAPGEWVRVDGVVEGTVEDIGFRSTRIRRFDRAPVHVPNAALSDAAVTNFTRMTHRQIFWTIGVEYRTTTEQLKIIRDGIMDYITGNDDFEDADKVATFVRIDSFGTSSIDIMVYCFTKTTVWGEWLGIKEDLAFAIKQIVTEKAGTAFAFPSQSLYVETWPEGNAPEPFVPPADNKGKAA